MRTTAIERELQIPILGTSELQIRWNGPREPQPARPRPGAIRDESHLDGRDYLYGQGAEGVALAC